MSGEESRHLLIALREEEESYCRLPLVKVSDGVVFLRMVRLRLRQLEEEHENNIAEDNAGICFLIVGRTAVPVLKEELMLEDIRRRSSWDSLYLCIAQLAEGSFDLEQNGARITGNQPFSIMS